MKGDREQCLEAGMDDYISKPLKPDELFAAINRWAEQRKENPAESEALAASVLPIAPLPKVKDEELPLNLAEAMPRFLNDKAFFDDICQGFLKDLPVRIADMQTALRDGNIKDFFRGAHNLKGISANFSAGPLTRLAIELEKMGFKEELNDAPDLLAQVEYEAKRFDQYCREVLRVS
jgi:two-component system sensor histidine kinase/response regulator